MHVIAAKAVAFGEALQPEFKDYQGRIVENAKALAAALLERGFRLVSGGTDNHLMLVDVRPQNLTGKAAENILHDAGITVNKNTIPFDPASPFVTSGVRIGTPAVTSRGLNPEAMKRVAEAIAYALTAQDDTAKLAQARDIVSSLCAEFPLYAELN